MKPMHDARKLQDVVAALRQRSGNRFLHQLDSVEKVTRALIEDSAAFVLLRAKMQSGKSGILTGAADCFANYWGQQNNICVFLINNLADNVLRAQTEASIREFRCERFIHHDHSQGLLSNGGIKRLAAAVKKEEVQRCLIILDESHVASEDSKRLMEAVDALVACLEMHHGKPCQILAVSATPYGIVAEAEQALGLKQTPYLKEKIVKILEPATSPQYRGIETFLQEDRFLWFSFDAKDKYAPFLESVQHEDRRVGFSICRVNKGSEAVGLKKRFERELSRSAYSVDVVGTSMQNVPELMHPDTFLAKVRAGLKAHREAGKVLRHFIAIVVKAFQMGQDWKELKSEACTLMETRRSNLAAPVQGLIGRACGYFPNTKLSLIASRPHVMAYAEIEQGASVTDTLFKYELDGDTSVGFKGKGKFKEYVLDKDYKYTYSMITDLQEPSTLEGMDRLILERLQHAYLTQGRLRIADPAVSCHVPSKMLDLFRKVKGILSEDFPVHFHEVLGNKDRKFTDEYVRSYTHVVVAFCAWQSRDTEEFAAVKAFFEEAGYPSRLACAFILKRTDESYPLVTGRTLTLVNNTGYRRSAYGQIFEDS